MGVPPQQGNQGSLPSGEAGSDTRTGPYTPSVVTKKRRRSQLARAGAQRQAARRAQRVARRRRRQIIASLVLVALAIAALVLWVVLHPDSATSRASGVDYPGVAHLAAGQATTTEGAR